jgi:hypothetical protein
MLAMRPLGALIFGYFALENENEDEEIECIEFQPRKLAMTALRWPGARLRRSEITIGIARPRALSEPDRCLANPVEWLAFAAFQKSLPISRPTWPTEK